MVKMHPGEAELSPGLVRALVRAQFPQWAELPVRRLASGGTVNAVYRLGDRFTVRLPLTEAGVGDLELELRWLPELAVQLPVSVPEIVAVGAPAPEYPWTWAIYRWIDGTTPVQRGSAGSEGIARDLAGFVSAMRAVDLPDGPVAYRGGPLAEIDQNVRKAIDELSRTPEPLDLRAATAAWEQALAAPTWSGPAYWVHSDLMPSNLLVRDGRLAAILDFGTVGVGDPACDLIPAWNLLPRPARKVFRTGVETDPDMWARGRGWALGMALVQLPYYRATNPVISANARFVLTQVIEELATGGAVRQVEQHGDRGMRLNLGQ